jgi:RimJ/RimL family protein N-acetyltransferase
MAQIPSEESFQTRTGRSVVIRPAVPDDAAEILAYLRRVGGETPYLTFGAEGVDRSVDDERLLIDRYAAREDALFLIARAGDEVVGVLTFETGTRARTRHVGEVGVSVAAAWHGEGIGRRMMERLLDWARDGGVVRKVNLRVRVDNAPAIALYERLGFRTEGRLTRDVRTDGVDHDVYAMGIEP